MATPKKAVTKKAATPMTRPSRRKPVVDNTTTKEIEDLRNANVALQREVNFREETQLKMRQQLDKLHTELEEKKFSPEKKAINSIVSSLQDLNPREQNYVLEQVIILLRDSRRQAILESRENLHKAQEKLAHVEHHTEALNNVSIPAVR